MINKPETIGRTHDLRYILVTDPVRNPEISSLWRVQESYKGKDLFHWYIDQGNTKYRACENSCGYYGKTPTGSEKWKCQVCTDKEKAKEISEQEKLNYKKRFEIRIAEACGAARKELPSANVRKARKGNRIVFTYTQHGIEESINSVLNRFNLKMSYTSRFEHPNSTYGRRQGDVVEFNPMRLLEKALNGEAE